MNPWPRLLPVMSPLAPLAMGPSVGHMGSSIVCIRTLLNNQCVNDSHNEPYMYNLPTLDAHDLSSRSMASAAALGDPSQPGRVTSHSPQSPVASLSWALGCWTLLSYSRSSTCPAVTADAADPGRSRAVPCCGSAQVCLEPRIQACSACDARR